MNDLRESFEASPGTSMREMAKLKGVANSTIQKAVADLGIASRVRPSRQLLTPKQKEARVTKGKTPVSALKISPRTFSLIS